MKILLIEDDREMAEHVAHVLGDHGHDVDTCHDGNQGLVQARANAYGALVVDRMLPGLDGLSLVGALRAEGAQTPVLLLTTMSGIDDRVQGLEGGADDYLTKPFAAAELAARVLAITRRSQGWGGATVLRAGDLEIDLIRRIVIREGRPIDLQTQEFRLLEYLMRNAGRTVTRAMLLDHVWNLDFVPSTNIVETHMSRLRTKIGCKGGEIIRTVRGAGYILRGN
jgi:two-component system OmpR family response regulator